jgi:hypothetical protein
MLRSARRHFLRDLMGRTLSEWERVRLEMGGIPQRPMSDLATLPDAVVRDVAPVFCGSRPTVGGDGRVFQSPATAMSTSGDWLVIDACDAALLERFGTGCTLGEISAWAVDQGLVDPEASWQRTRLLFLRLVAYGLCRPAQPLNEVGLAPFAHPAKHAGPPSDGQDYARN